MFESLNKKKTVMDGINTEGMEFKKLKEFKNSTIDVKGFFFTYNKFTGAKQAVVVTDTCLVSMPNRAVLQFEAIENTPAMLNAVLAGKLKIEVHDMIEVRAGTTIDYELKG